MDIFHSYNHIQKQIILTADLKQKIEYEFVFGWSVHQNSLVERVDGGGFHLSRHYFQNGALQQIIWRENWYRFWREDRTILRLHNDDEQR